MPGDHVDPRSAAWILRMAAANDAIGDLVAAMARQIAVPGPDADGALAAARAAYEAATGSPADDALLSIYQPDALAITGCLPQPDPPREAQSGDIARSSPRTAMAIWQLVRRSAAISLVFRPPPRHRRT